MENTKTLYSLQLLRFIASILVLCFHLEFIKSGYKGVDIFFVISGFVMYFTTFILKPKDAATFIINRITKIYILYWLIMLLHYLFFPYNLNIALVKTFLLTPGHSSILGVSWSLSYELYFYFIFGTSVYLLPEKYFKIAFLLLFVFSSCITLINTTHLSIKGTPLNFLLGQNLWEFLLGILSALVYHKIYNKTNPIIAVAFSLLSLSLILLIDLPYMYTYAYIIYGILSFCIVLSFTVLEYQIPVYSTAKDLFKMLGDASYAIYLLGPLVTSILIKYNYPKVTVIPLTIILSVFINRFAEMKLLKTTRRFLYKYISPVK